MRTSSAFQLPNPVAQRIAQLAALGLLGLLLSTPSMAAADCSDSALVLPAACEWGVVAGSSRNPGQSLLRSSVVVRGSVCAQSTSVGLSSYIDGDVVAAAPSGRASLFGPAAVVTGSIVTGGAAICGAPASVMLPGLDMNMVAGGDWQVQSDSPERLIDATGPNPSVDRCRDAVASVLPSAKVLDSTAFRMTDDEGVLTIPDSETVTYTATKTVNVLDFVRLSVGDNSILILDGNSIPMWFSSCASIKPSPFRFTASFT